MKTINEIRTAIEDKPARSAWDRGVKIYALDLLDDLAEAIDDGYFDPADFENPQMLHVALLNGASNWSEYSHNGCAHFYDSSIAKLLCSPSELKRNRSGERNPNSRETWLDVQARALSQAENMIFQAWVG